MILRLIAPSLKSIDEREIYRYITKVIAFEINQVNKPCYHTKLIKYYKDIQNKADISDFDIKTFKSSISTYYKSMFIFTDSTTILLLMIILNFLRTNRPVIAKEFFTFLSIKFYASLMHKHFKFCNGDLWSVALDRISEKHLFKVHGGIGKTITYLSDDTFNKNVKILSKSNISDKELALIVYSLRTRLAQSVRSFANTYHSMAGEKKSIGSMLPEEEIAGAQLIADKQSMTICTYNQIDKSALIEAIEKSGIRKDIAYSIVSEFSNPEHRARIRFIIILAGRHGNLKTVCMERTRNLLIKKMSSNQKIGKYLLRKEILDLIDELNISSDIKTINKDQLIIFFIHYLTLFLRNRIC